MSSDKLDILVFGAHPDDAEIGMGGTIAKHTRAGYRVGLCDLTYAELSSNGDVKTRQQEAEQARSLLDCAVRSNLGLPDRGLRLVQEQIDLITMEIRKYKPRLVFAPYWEDRHPDHVMCSKLLQEAVFNAKLRNVLPHTEAVKVEALYYYFINDTADADMMVDISDCKNIKKQALEAYRSQFMRLDGNSVSTPLTEAYIDRVVARDLVLGQKKAVSAAEGFICKSPINIDLF